MNANSSEHGTEGVSRRSFIGVTVGSIVMLPTVANAMLLPTGAALAETGEFAELVGGSRIHIVSANELGVVVRDVSRQGDTLESEWNPRGEDGELLNVEDDWALAPGMSARYYVEYVTIPDSWEGDKEIGVYITAVHASGSDAMSAQAEESPATQAEQESIEYIPQRRVRYTLTMDGDTTEVTYAGTYSKADVTVMGSPVKPDDEGGSGGGASTKASSGKSGLPSTGDVLSVAALALAGAAGAVAHRALRSREESEDDEA